NHCNTSVLIFFFSSRRRHTRSKRDWSSDVCSSDLRRFLVKFPIRKSRQKYLLNQYPVGQLNVDGHLERWRYVGLYIERRQPLLRSEERRVGKECRSRWAP